MSNVVVAMVQSSTDVGANQKSSLLTTVWRRASESDSSETVTMTGSEQRWQASLSPRVNFLRVDPIVVGLFICPSQPSLVCDFLSIETIRPSECVS